MRILYVFSFLFAYLSVSAQTANISGKMQTAEGEAVAFASVALYQKSDSALVKAAATNDAGAFTISNLKAGAYFLKSTFIGLPDLVQADLILADGQSLNLGTMRFLPASIQLNEAVVTAKRRLVEVHADKTVFNVDGTINSTGSNGLELLRKAPGVTVDNNDNVSVLGRAGVLVYVDGKRLPIAGEELSNYLQNLQAAQIDRIDIITNPGAKYEAEGNAGIIDIRLKKDKNLGANGTVNTTYSQGRYARYNLIASGNYRQKGYNIFGNVGYNIGSGYNDMKFYTYQNGLVLDEIANMSFKNRGPEYRIGTDFYIGKKQIIGFLMSGRNHDAERIGLNRITLAQEQTPAKIDSILVAEGNTDIHRTNHTYNINYRYERSKTSSIGVDLDYGRFTLANQRFQPNKYYDASEQVLLTEISNNFDTPSDIEIYTAKLDYEQELLGGQFGIGTKYSKVVSDNTFLFYDVANGNPVLNDRNSNRFKYDEKVAAAYVNYARKLAEKWNVSAGLRAEKTDAVGDLQAFLPDLQEPPVVLDYLSWFPSAGLTFQASPIHAFALNYGRRINRPDYNVLNPFNNQLSQLSYEKGNPFLRPEIVNNLELGYTYNYRFNFKIAHSVTTDQITRLIAPDDEDPRAGFISWDNLAEQRTTSFNASAPFSANKWWDIYLNASASYLDNQADYGNGAIVDIQAFSYSFYAQNTFSLPKGIKAELSGWYGGPGVWGGVFLYDPSWSLDVGLQKKFLKEKLAVRISGSDLFFQSYWSGISSFNGLVSEGEGRNDTRRLSINLNYMFGNQNVKSRKHKTGSESEAERVGN